MEIFRDLCVHGSREKVAAIIGEVERSLNGGWKRDFVAEEGMRSLATDRSAIFCFSCTKDADRPAATVFLGEKGEFFYVSNVVPHGQHQLSYHEYNRILEEFCERFLRPPAERAGLRVELTATQADLEKWLSPGAAERLRRFSRSANKSTGSAHPSDREQWNDFVLAAHRDHCDFSESTLRRWLIQVEGWPPEVASQLAIEYEYGRELLAFSESRRSA